METNSPHVVAQSSQIRSCVNCIRAKAKCVFEQELGGKCSSRFAVDRVEKLEKKLDSLVTRLTTSHETASVTPELTPHVTSSTPSVSHASFTARPTTESLLSLNSDVNGPDNNAENWDERLLRGGPIRQRFALIGAHDPAMDPPLQQSLASFSLGSSDLGIENPELLLHIFKNEMNPSFPFISIPESTTALDLRGTRPSLYTAVMAVTSRDSVLQGKLGTILMQQLADRALVAGERNLDLLLAVLTYAGWCYYHFFNIPRLTSLISMATTLVGDLGLQRHVVKDVRGFYEGALRETCKTLPPTVQTHRTMEERRTVLGYWYISSAVSSFFHRFDAPIWTPYLAKCQNMLYESNDHRDDRFAVALIKIQLLADQIGQSPWHSLSEPNVQAPPPALYLKSLEGCLEVLKQEMASEFTNNTFLDLTCQSAEITLYKIGLSKTHLLSTVPSRDFNRLEILFACQKAVKSFFDATRDVPATQYHCMPVHFMMHLSWNMGILQMLSTFDHPDWNVAWMRESISFPVVLQQLADRLSSVKVALGIDPNTAERLDMFSQSAKRMTWIKSFFEKSTAVGAQRNDQGDAASVMDDGFGLPSEFMDIDDSWMRDLLGGTWDF